MIGTGLLCCCYLMRYRIGFMSEWPVPLEPCTRPAGAGGIAHPHSAGAGPCTLGWRRETLDVSTLLTSVDRPEPHNPHDEPRSVRTRPVPRNVVVACDSTSVSSSDARDHMDLLVQVERWEPRELMLRNEIVGDPGELEPGRMSGVSLRTSRICEFIRWRT